MKRTPIRTITTTLLALTVLGLSALASADVAVAVKDGQYTVNAPVYQAVIAKDGCLTNLRVRGNEFLAPGVNCSRGTYFHQDGVVKLESITQPAPNIVATEGPKAAARYEFSDTGAVWTVKNKTDKGMAFFAILPPEVEAMKGDGGALTKPVVNGTWKDTVWYRGVARLELNGSTKHWGPWAGPFQVWEVTLAPKEERQIKLTMGEASSEEVAALEKFFAPPELMILSPRNLEVFQRKTLKEGDIVISGRVHKDADKVEVRIIGQARTRKLRGHWRKVPFVKGYGSFNLRTDLLAGGWYKLEARALKDGEVVATAEVPQFGVGEVFVGAGQSNSTNCGQFRIKQSSGMVSAFSGTDWRIADDPQPGVHDRTQNGSFWPAFGDAMYAKYGVPIGVAVTGHGGTSVNAWHPSTELFGWMMRRIQQLGPQGFRGVLWHQGENDVGMTTNEYYRKFSRIIRTSKQRAGWEFPWFVAKVSYHNPDRPSFDSTRNAHQMLWDKGVALEGPDTDTLKGDTRDHDGKGIHFSPKGLKIHGEMWAGYAEAYLDPILDD